MDIEILDWTSDLDRPSAIDALDTADLPVCHTVSVTERRIAIDDRTLIQNNVRTDTLALNLDGEWDGANVVVLIGKTGSEVELEWRGEPVVIPAQVAESVGAIDVSVVGYSSDGTVRLVTAEAAGAMTVIRSGALTGEVPAEEAPDVLAQLLESAADARRAATEADEAAATAHAAADRVDEAIDTANSAASQATSAAESATAATAKATEAASAANEAANEASSIIAQLPLPDGNVPRATRRGEVVSVDDAFAAVPLGLKVYGKTRQNLWVNPSGTSNGVTVTANGDGSVTLSGTSSAGMSAYNKVYVLKPNTTYTFTLDKTLAGNPGYAGERFQIEIAGGSVVKLYNAGSVSFTTKDSAEHAMMAYVCANAGTTVSGTYRVMLNEGSTAEPWCPPGIHGVGELMAHERNLWVNPSGSKVGVTVTANGDGSITLSGTATSSGVVADAPFYVLKPSTTYTLSTDDYIPEGIKFVVRQNEYGQQEILNSSTKKLTFTTESEFTGTCGCFVSVTEGTTVSGTYRVMLNEGATASPWVPPQVESCVVVRSVGKNLLDYTNPTLTGTSMGAKSVSDDGVISANNPASDGRVASYGTSDYRIRLAAGEYTVMFDVIGTTDVGARCAIIFSESGSQLATDYTNFFASTGVKTHHVTLAEAGSIGIFMKLYTATCRIAVLAGNVSNPEWSEYTGTIIPVDLKGEVLYDLPDGTADVLDVGSGSVVKRTELDTYNGSESWVKDAGKASVGAYYKHNPGFRYKDRLSIISDGLPNENPHSVSYPCVTAFSHESGTEVRARTPSNDSVETHKAWLAANPVTVVYPIATPTTSTVTPVALPTLPSPVCNVWAVSDVPCEVEMEYVRDVNVVLAKLEGAM